MDIHAVLSPDTLDRLSSNSREKRIHALEEARPIIQKAGNTLGIDSTADNLEGFALDIYKQQNFIDPGTLSALLPAAGDILGGIFGTRQDESEILRQQLEEERRKQQNLMIGFLLLAAAVVAVLVFTKK